MALAAGWLVFDSGSSVDMFLVFSQPYIYIGYDSVAPIRSGTIIQSCLALVSLPASRVSSNRQRCAVVRIFAHINVAADAYAAQAAESFLRDRRE